MMTTCPKAAGWGKQVITLCIELSNFRQLYVLPVFFSMVFSIV